MMNTRRTLSLAFLSLSFSPLAQAWGELGHGVVALVAQSRLTPEARGLVFSAIGHEPLDISAVWPDMARPDDRYADFAPLHFLTFPPGKQSFAEVTLAERPVRDAAVVIDKVPALLGDKTTPASARAVWLRYLVHVVGDVHQPLHVGNAYDRGANLCDVKLPSYPGSDRLFGSNLHSVMDDKVMDYLKKEFEEANISPIKKLYFEAKTVTEYLLRENANAGADKVDYEQAVAASSIRWYDESHALHGMVYPDATPVKNPLDREYCKVVNLQTGKVENGKYNPAKVPTLDAGYFARVLPMVKRQMVLAGYRLAGVLNAAAVRAGSQPYTAEQQKADIAENVLLNK